MGKALGPVKGPDAWYIVRVNARNKAQQNVSVKEEKTRELVKQDFLTYRFLEWAKDVMARADVK